VVRQSHQKEKMNQELNNAIKKSVEQHQIERERKEMTHNPQKALKKFVAQHDLESVSMLIPMRFAAEPSNDKPRFNYKTLIRSKRGVMSMDHQVSLGVFKLDSYMREPAPDADALAKTAYKVKQHELATEMATSGMPTEWLDFESRDRVIVKPPKVELEGVLRKLCLDASVLEYKTYQDWCKDSEYGEDSREGWKIYESCKAQSKQFLELLGCDKQALQELIGIVGELDTMPEPIANQTKLKNR
jgi:hypothetical protein